MAEHYVLGIDPGFRATGWAALRLGERPALAGAGVFTTKKASKKRGLYQADDDTLCMEELASGLEGVLRRFRPVATGVEVPAGSKSSRAARTMGMAHTIAVLVVRAETGELPLSMQAADGKRAATDNAGASKDDVELAMRELLTGEAWDRALADVAEKKREHAYDAASVALAALDSDTVRAVLRVLGGQGGGPT